MESRWVLTGVGERLLTLTSRAAGERRQTVAGPLLTVDEACRRLGRSRRQVYRYLHAGRLQAGGRILGQWLIAQGELDRFPHARVPRALQRFFWDVRVSGLSTDHHRDFIAARLLEFGDRSALRWLFRAYPKEALRAFLAGRGAAVLPRRTWHFWALQLQVPGGQRGRTWGGLR